MARLLSHKIDRPNVPLGSLALKEANQVKRWNYLKRNKVGLADFGLNSQHLLWKLMKVITATEHKKKSYHIRKQFSKQMNNQLRTLAIEN